VNRLLASLKARVPAPWWGIARAALRTPKAWRSDRRDNRRVTRRDAPMLVVSEIRPLRRFYDHWLHWVETSRPELRRAIRLGRTPGARARSARVLHAWIQDPVRERDPWLADRLLALERAVVRRGGIVINPVDVLSRSLRDVMVARLADLPLRLPAVTRLPADAGVGFAREFGYPVMVRHRFGHAKPMELLHDEDSWHAWRERHVGRLTEWVLTEFIDVRNDDGLYRKYRHVSFGRWGVPRHLIVSPCWEVRPKDRVLTEATRNEELEFVHRESRPYETVLEQARLALGFDIGAFDFSYDATGALVLWEVNPYPDLSPPRAEVCKYMPDVVHGTYAALANYYEECLAAR